VSGYILLLLLLLLFSRTYHRVFVPWYISEVSGVSHRSGFRFQNVVLSLLYVMFPVQLFFCRESMECLPGIVSRYFFSPLVTIPVVPMTTGMTKHFIFHVR
jgi:hypothetical protein